MTSLTVHPFLLTFLRGSREHIPVPSSREDGAWEQIISDADTHALTPLLYRWLCRGEWDSRLPPRLHEQLRERVFGLAARNLILAQELATILRAFQARRLACMPLRGPALAEQLYGETTTRPMGDLDLLVHHHSLAEVGRTLADLGFVEMDRRAGFSRAYSYTLKFIKDQHGWIVVEPHWTIAYPPFAERLDMSGVWERSVQGQVVGVDTRLLSRVDLLLHLCFHLIHRGREAPLLWYYELDRLIRQHHRDLDWSSLARIAQQAGQEFLVSQVFEKLQNVLRTPVPQEVLSQLSQPSASGVTRPVAGWVERRLAHLMINEANVDGVESFALLLTLKSLRAKLTYAFALLFPSPAFMVLQYGLSDRKSLGLWYLRRAGCLTWEALKGLVVLVASRRTADHRPRP